MNVCDRCGGAGYRKTAFGNVMCDCTLSDVNVHTTHYEGCYDAGPKHYECALREIERLKDKLAHCERLFNTAVLDRYTAIDQLYYTKQKLCDLKKPQKLRPMSEAPRDDTDILLYDGLENAPAIGRYYFTKWRNWWGEPLEVQDFIGWLPLPEVELP